MSRATIEPAGTPDAGGSVPVTADLPRKLGFWDATFLVVGSVIGSGIFLVPSSIAKQVSEPLLIVLVWVISGILTFLGALTYAELGAILPKTGGQYVFLREAYGPLWGFLYGWVLFLVIQTGSIAAVAVAFAKYLAYFLPLQKLVLIPPIPIGTGKLLFTMQLTGIELAAIGAILLLSLINAASVSFGAAVQNSFTLMKSAALLGLVVVGFLLGTPQGAPVGSAGMPGGGGFLSAFGVAMIAALWAYDGWNNVSFTAGEIKEPHRTVPRSLFWGTLAVTALYVAANLVYLHILSPVAIASSNLVAADVAGAFLGPVGGGLISAAILVSTFGCVNGFILAGPRVYFAMARDGLFFPKIAEVHPRFLTPAFAIGVQAVWAALLALSGSFDLLFTFVMFVSWVFYGMTAAAIFVLRRKRPDLPRPYRCWGYPVVPLLFVAMSAWLVVNTFQTNALESRSGLVILLLGVPAYLWLRRRSV